MVVSVAGNVDHAKVVRQVRRPSAARASSTAPPSPSSPATPVRAARAVTPGEARTIAPASSRSTSSSASKGLTRTDDAALRPRRAQHRPRRRHVVAAVPGGARAPRPGLLRLLLRQPPRRRRAWSGSRSAACPASTTPCSRPCAPSCAKVAADGITAEELERGKGQLKRRPRARARGLRLADVAPRQGRAGLRRAARRSTRWSAGSRPSPSRTSRALAREVFTQPELLAVVGPAA